MILTVSRQAPPMGAYFTLARLIVADPRASRPLPVGASIASRRLMIFNKIVARVTYLSRPLAEDPANELCLFPTGQNTR
jgi:hypothetical protein